ncbi:MAG: GNAT family N-acetyltransferase [Pseudonocardiales bacterium]|nr:GNAT family N-acetyltransferase [Pseudonocardiales bacterium]MBV9029514.1 GNAT family N-acetyltransferase [Pseudonocardiales bacterium]MBW0010624.1 GNAT family N-acetyltransferase [Pseudonocardiales bacterium]
MALARVRGASVEDADVLAALHRATWRAAYSALLPPGTLDVLDAPQVREAWADTVRGGATVLIATEGDDPVGFVVAGPAPEDDVAAADGTLPSDAAHTMLVSTLLVEPRWGRRGHGGRLLAVAATVLRDAGATRGIVWVPVEDPASRSFYRRAGWIPDGTVRTLDAAGRPLRELRLTGPLTLTLV